MIINNFDKLCVGVIPHKTDSVLIIDTNAVLSNSIACQGF